MNKLSGYRALVTGASSGIGADIARSLARRGVGLVLVARRDDRLRTLAAELTAAHGVAAEVITADLAAPGAAADVWRRASAGGAPDLLINNAGFGVFQKFGTIAIERELEMLRLNISVVVELAHAFVTAHRDRTPDRPAYLLNVASIAAWQATPHFATYAASKSFVRSFSEAMYFECRDRSVVVSCLCPGGTVTEFHAVSGAGDYGRIANASMLSSATVAEAGVQALLRDKKTLVTGTLNKISCLLTGMLPRGLSSRASMLVLGSPKVHVPQSRTLP
jgi:short-subunit dehydrogenase